MFQQCDVALMDVTVWELMQDVWTLVGLMKELPIESPRRHRILGALERMVDVVDPADVSATAAAGRDALAPALALPASASSHSVVAIGHAHIDSAWLWPIRETIRKCARTFSSVVALMDADPEFRFACSSAQQLKWMKDGYPEIFERIKEKVATGQFIPVGGMWVEPDMNLPGAEAMARQFVAGKRFFLEEFGVDTREAWIPDTFGYSGAHPADHQGVGHGVVPDAEDLVEPDQHVPPSHLPLGGHRRHSPVHALPARRHVRRRGLGRRSRPRASARSTTTGTRRCRCSRSDSATAAADPRAR